MRRWLVAAVMLPLVVACGPSGGAGQSGPTAAWHPPVAPGTTGSIAVGNRPFDLHVPVGYDRAKPSPLVVLLHGYGSSGAQQERYFNLTPESDRRGFLYAMPNGTTNRDGSRFWNAAEACCDVDDSGVDDVAYLERLLDTVESTYSVDTGRVYLVGHSNGGFMAYRMACERSMRITAVVSLAGAVDDGALCTPQRPVTVLEIHGTADATIKFRGGTRNGHRYTSVDATLAIWRRINGCSAKADTSAPHLDLEPRLPDAETGVTSYSAGCRDASRVELWDIREGSHVPTLNAIFPPAVTDFLYRNTPRS
ncbi:alpha/beta fold hydrolase [Micromonospora sp. WMMD1120]|uniref:alpha/beta hydrolase family esterase n=1 Tax=Micromonospora sp. WMMD1120 TaxID=3016106 RepID=UPI0024160CFB|nr:alpha/beta fold hydrolase [Micromonospora sp. WMMD1120]MDG4808160.1 alpha/beta fold hydrolase [Micromonospora sp. WMMD1120]